MKSKIFVLLIVLSNLGCCCCWPGEQTEEQAEAERAARAKDKARVAGWKAQGYRMSTTYAGQYGNATGIVYLDKSMSDPERAFRLSYTRVLVIDSSWFKSQIRVKEGTYAGVVGWIAMEHVKTKEPYP